MECLSCLCLGLGIFIFVVILVLFLVKADADLTLLFYEKFKDFPKFHDQVVWITGGSSGIGEYLAYEFAACHAKLALSGVSMEKLEKVKRNCLERSDLKETDILLLPFSLENFSVHEECVGKVIDTFGHIDILVNNAGVSQRADFEDIEIEVDQKLFNVNVFGTVNLTRKVLKYMLERGKGHIAVTSSMAGKVGAPYSSSYTGSKHALHGYFDSLRTEMIAKNIGVTIACPGPVFSDLLSRCLASKQNQLHDDEQSLASKRMATDRCSHLMMIAIANKLDECWICMQPLLVLYYFSQYTPAFFKSVLIKRFFNKERIQAMRSGKN